MRKLLIAIVLLTGLVNAQNYLERGNAFVLYDSLWNSIYVPDTVFAISGTDTLGSLIDTSAAQTVVEIPLKIQ